MKHGIDPRQVLADGAAALDLEITDTVIDALLRYVGLLDKWNRVYNLTAIRDVDTMVVSHVLDSLAILPYISGKRILDVGSGAGLPGIPLAICNPEQDFVLLDANSKKTRFLQQAVIELSLSNVAIKHSRIENYHPGEGFDTVVSRAFAALGDFVSHAGRLCGPGGRLVAMKARRREKELETLPQGFAVDRAVTLKVPGIGAARMAVIVAPVPLAVTSSQQ